ncbi:MAG TPA: patatin-like phospholipase family protein [Bryobacteraceae bacterium]|nr:patatin-like phospholipase family protein [Bryobacteraceae bacterium]
MAYCILSCDGGGIRGLLPALLIQQLSTDIPSFLGSVSLFAGTSAGGLVSLALASGVSTAKVVSLFQNDGSQIFTPFNASAVSAVDVAKLRASLQERGAGAASESWYEWVIEHFEELLDDLLYVKYNNTGLQALLKSLLPSTPLKQLTNRVLVTTFQLNNSKTGNWAPITISNFPDDPGAATYPIDAALSTSAAPTYFPPYQHPTFGYCADGGVYANNPGCMAIAAALNSGVALSDIVMLSLGTGMNPENVQITPPATDYGPLMWMLPIAYGSTPASPILSILMDGVASADAFICQQLLGSKFQRLQVPLTSAVPLDDYQAVPQLVTAATDYMKTSCWSDAENWVRTTFA